MSVTQLSPGPKVYGHCHRLVAQVAKEAAGELYETVMCDNAVRAEWKRLHPGLGPKALETEFIRTKWKHCIPFARATLAQLLTKPIDESLKAEIHLALVQDASLSFGRGPVVSMSDWIKQQESRGP